MMSWLQREIELPPFPPGCHLVTRQVLEGLPELSAVSVGLLHIFIQHTSASLSINENADPDVAVDLARVLDAVVPENFFYRHTIEGPDDMPAHVKTSLTDSSLTVPICGGQLGLGTWQGIYLFEHRRDGGHRRLVLTVQGEMES